MTTRVPGKPSYEYGSHNGQTGIFRWVTSGRGEDRDTNLEQVLDWYPRVVSYIVRLSSKRKILEARYTLEIDGHADTIDAGELAEAAAWQKWPGAVGIHDRVIREVVAIIVQAEARKRTMIADAPYWDGDRLVRPDGDLLPRGYGEHHDAGDIPELLHLAIANPKMALILGTSYAAPYVEPLGRQPFWLALGGDTSKGKTTALLAASSLHGRPGRKGVNRSWNNTMNGVNVYLGELSVLPIFLDEIHMHGFTGATLKKAVHTTCDGADRFTSSRRKKVSDSPSWYGVLFSTGNLSVTGLCPQPEIAVRVVEIPAPITDSSATSKRIKEIARTTYGWWDPVTLDTMAKAISIAEGLIGLPEDGGAEERIVENLALGVAGAAMMGTLHLGREGGRALGQAALQAAKDLLAIQVDELAESGRTPSDRFLEEIRQSIVSRPSRWPSQQDYLEWVKGGKSNGPDSPGRPPSVDVWGFHEDGTVQILAKFADELARAAGLDNARIALRELKESRHLQTGSEEGEHLRRRPRIGGRRFDVYQIDLDHEPSKGAKSTGTTGTTGTTGDESAAQSPFDPWSRSVPGREATGTSGTREAPVSPGPVPGPGPGPGRVVPVNGRHAQQRAALDEQLANFKRVIARSERWPDATDQELVAGVRTWSVALGGLSFGGNPARCGQLLFEKLAGMPNVPELTAPPRQVVPASKVATVFNMCDREADVAASPYVVGVDVNAQFLAAATGELGTGNPVPTDDWRSVLKLPGYVLLGEPVTVGPGCVIPAGTWIANPMAVYLLGRGGDLVVTQGYHWPQHRRWLALWARTVRTARADLMARDDLASAMALVALKSMYSAFLGGWLNSGPDRGDHNRTDTLRPDWMHMVHSLARANKLRALDKAPVRPFATLADSAYFLLGEPDAPGGLELSTQPGKWKVHRIGRAGDAAMLTVNGRPRPTTLAEQVAKGSLGNVSKVIKVLHEQYQGQGVVA